MATKQEIKQPGYYPQIPCGIYNGNGQFLFFIKTFWELNEVRLQIKREEREGYYIDFLNHKIDIKSNGELSEWPTDFFNWETEQLNELFGI